MKVCAQGDLNTLACGLAQGTALGPHWGPIHYCPRSFGPSYGLARGRAPGKRHCAAFSVRPGEAHGSGSAHKTGTAGRCVAPLGPDSLLSPVLSTCCGCAKKARPGRFSHSLTLAQLAALIAMAGNARLCAPHGASFTTAGSSNLPPGVQKNSHHTVAAFLARPGRFELSTYRFVAGHSIR